MYRFTKRLLKIQSIYNGKPFFLTLFDEFNMRIFYLQMQKYGLNTSQSGQVILINSASPGFIAIIQYNAQELGKFEAELNGYI
ncbi:MAG: hypothetical protein QM479_17250 [Pseudomonadota bacterium]